MPKSKNRRTTGRVATRRAPVWLSSREYKQIVAKMYLLEMRLEEARSVLGNLLKAMTQQAEAVPADTGTPGVEASNAAAV